MVVFLLCGFCSWVVAFAVVLSHVCVPINRPVWDVSATIDFRSLDGKKRLEGNKMSLRPATKKALKIIRPLRFLPNLFNHMKDCD